MDTPNQKHVQHQVDHQQYVCHLMQRFVLAYLIWVSISILLLYKFPFCTHSFQILCDFIGASLIYPDKNQLAGIGTLYHMQYCGYQTFQQVFKHLDWIKDNMCDDCADD